SQLRLNNTLHLKLFVNQHFFVPTLAYFVLQSECLTYILSLIRVIVVLLRYNNVAPDKVVESVFGVDGEYLRRFMPYPMELSGSAVEYDFGCYTACNQTFSSELHLHRVHFVIVPKFVK